MMDSYYEAPDDREGDCSAQRARDEAAWGALLNELLDFESLCRTVGERGPSLTQAYNEFWGEER